MFTEESTEITGLLVAPQFIADDTHIVSTDGLRFVHGVTYGERKGLRLHYTDGNSFDMVFDSPDERSKTFARIASALTEQS